MLDYFGEEKGLNFMKRLAQLAPEIGEVSAESKTIRVRYAGIKITGL